VTADVAGDKIGAVVRNGRPDKGMPRFDYSDQQIAGLMSFIHIQQNDALTKKGGRKGVDASDLQTGNVEAGKRYFEGAGGCGTCHSPTGDLAGIASRYNGLELEEQMLYPKHAESKVTVTLDRRRAVQGGRAGECPC
jgi:cytochrome c oxidase cbb3-type subunit 3